MPFLIESPRFKVEMFDALARVLSHFHVAKAQPEQSDMLEDQSFSAYCQPQAHGHEHHRIDLRISHKLYVICHKNSWFPLLTP